MMELGIRAHDLGRSSPEQLAQQLVTHGVRWIQFAPAKSLDGWEALPDDHRDDLGMSPQRCEQVGRIFCDHQIGIAVLGCYVNPIHPDLTRRRLLMNWFKHNIRMASRLGCSLVGLETGSIHPDYRSDSANSSDRNFAECRAVLEELVDEARLHNVRIGIEGVVGHVVSTPALMRRMLDAIGDEHLRVIFDPVNYLSVENHRQQRAIMDQTADLLAAEIEVLHLKDFTIDGERLIHKTAGLGQFEQDYLLQLYRRHWSGRPVILEEITSLSLDETLRGLRKR